MKTMFIRKAEVILNHSIQLLKRSNRNERFFFLFFIMIQKSDRLFHLACVLFCVHF